LSEEQQDARHGVYSLPFLFALVIVIEFWQDACTPTQVARWVLLFGVHSSGNASIPIAAAPALRNK
jgi:hypothetical protein